MMPLRIGGVTPLSTTDYPDHLSAVVFCQGCPWRCGYCHNPHLIPAAGDAGVDWGEVTAFLGWRVGLLDAVVFSGGEPTLQPGLAVGMHLVRSMGFKVGLHTAGMYPERLGRLLPLLDWVGLDIKAPFSDYARVTGVPGSGVRARLSLDLILESGAAYECRTTVDPGRIGERDVQEIAQTLAALGVRHYALQACRGGDGAGPSGGEGSDWFERLGRRVAPLFEHFTLRPAS